MTRGARTGPAFLAAVLALSLAAVPALAAKAIKPDQPEPTGPSGTVGTAMPTFAWTAATNAVTYEVRVYQGKKLAIDHTAISGTSWTSTPLPTDVDLNWKVRAISATGTAGTFSGSMTFKIVVDSTAKAITAFSFQGLTPPVTGSVDEIDHQVMLTVPPATVLTALVATFVTSGASVKVGTTPQVSGTTPNDFSSDLTYTVTAADASTQDYKIVVIAIGGAYEGGLVGYNLKAGDPGYVAAEAHGLIVATVYAPGGIIWSNAADSAGAVGTAIGTGQTNTTVMMSQHPTAGAGFVCDNYSADGYSDWYLPSRDELIALVPGASLLAWPGGYLWSSSEADSGNAIEVSFDSGLQGAWFSVSKTADWVSARCVRSF